MKFKVGDRVRIKNNLVQIAVTIGHVGKILDLGDQEDAAFGHWVIIEYPGARASTNTTKYKDALGIWTLQLALHPTTHLPDFL